MFVKIEKGICIMMSKAHLKKTKYVDNRYKKGINIVKVKLECYHYIGI